MPIMHVFRLCFLTVCFMVLSVVSAQETPDLDAIYDDDDETFVFAYPSGWTLTESTDGFGVDLVGTVGDSTLTISIESLPYDLMTESAEGERTTVLDTLANTYDLEDYDYIMLDDRNAVIDTVGTANRPITVLIMETTYTPSQFRYAVIFAITDTPQDDDEGVQETILAIAGTVIERDAETVFSAPSGLGGVVSGGSDSEIPQNSIRDLVDDEPESSDEDDENTADDASRGIGNVFGSDSDDDD